MLIANQNKNYVLFLIIIISVQVILSIIAFNKFFVFSDNYMFLNTGDGIRSYFTLLSYLQQDFKDGLLKYNMMNYPFGDYIYYGDSNLWIAFFVKLFSHFIWDINSYSIQIINLFYIVGFIFSSVLIYKILFRFLHNIILIVILSITLPWINPQALKLFAGHFSLSSSWALLLIFYLLIKMYESPTKKFLIALISLILIIAISFIHFYYLAMLDIFFFAYCISIGIYKIIQREKFFTFFLVGILVPLFSFLTVFFIIKLTDPYNEFRLSPQGYDWIEFKLQFTNLFSHYTFNTIKFPFTHIKNDYTDQNSYLGNFALYGMLFIMGLKLFSPRNFIPFKKIFFENAKGQILFFGLLASVLCLITSLGERIELFDATFLIYNYLNPLLLLHQFTDKITQFRVLARFAYPFFWIFNFSIAFILDFYLRKKNEKFIFIAITIFLFFACMDCWDFIGRFNMTVNENTLTKQSAQGYMRNLVQGVDVKDYQAILPIPYYYVSSEDYNITIDLSYEWWTTQTFQLSLLTNLPLMSNSWARSAHYQNQALIDIFLNKKLSRILLNQLNDKPILVVFNKNQLNSIPITLTSREPAATVYQHGQEIINEYKMKELKSMNDYVLYRWDNFKK